jgi:TonB family protein
MSAELLAGNIVAHWVQSGVLAAAAVIAMRVMRFHEPRLRLAALHLTMLAIVALPFVQPMRSDEPAPAAASSEATVSVAEAVYDVAASQDPAAPAWLTPARAGLAALAAGIVVRLLWLFYGIITLARFSRAASDIPPPSAAGDLEAALQISPRYMRQTGNRGPWTFGFLRPTVALPAEFDALAPAFQRAVICHELLHIKRRDIAVALLEELAVAALWFHPWMWLLRARIRVAREQVVDSRVVGMLDNRDDYVRCLVDLSGHDLAPHVSQAGAGMLRPRELRSRVDAIFQEVPMSRMRVVVAAVAFVGVTMATGLIAVASMPLRGASLESPSTSQAMPMLVSRYLIGERLATPIRWSAAARPQVAQPQTTAAAPRKQINRVYPEYPQDALEAGIKGVVIVDVTVNAAGDVSTAAVVSGPQALRASAFKAALGMKFTPGSSVTATQITFEYVLTGTTWGVKIGEALPNMGLRPYRATNEIQRAIESLDGGRYSNPDATGAYRIGGGLMPPKKVKDVAPVYPPLAQEARVQGVVIMEARVDEQGNVSDVRVLRSIPLLDQAAIDSVKQWQYDPTLLNGSPIAVIMTVTVNFTLRDTTRDAIRMQVLLPDGTPFMEGEFRTDVPILIDAKGVGRYHLKASRLSATDVRVSVFGEDGQDHLGDVLLVAGGPVVQAPTSPPLGLQWLAVRLTIQ